MSLLLFGGSDYLNKIQSVRPQNLVSLWPQNEPAGGISTEIVRGYDGAYTGVTLGQPGVPGSGLTSAGYDGVTSYNDIYTAGFANDNLLLNPGFETAGATWANWTDTVGDGAIANEVGIVHEGTDAAKLTSGVTSNTKTAQAVVVIPGERRRERIWARGDAVNAGRYGIYDVTNGADIIPITTTGVTAAAWGMVAVEFTVPAGCVSARIDLWCPPVNGGICYFDACEVRRMDGFLGDQGTIIVPAQVANVGVWTDATARNMFSIRVDPDNRIHTRRNVANNTIDWVYRAGAVSETHSIAALTTLDWMMCGITWSIQDDAVNYYYLGNLVATDTVLGTWVGDLSATETIIGASDTVPTSVWSGNIAYVPVWSDALSPDEMRYLG